MGESFELLEIIDESCGSVLIFTDPDIFEQYNTAQARGLEFDFDLIEERQWDGVYALA